VCGIAGYLNLDRSARGDDPALTAMIETLRHRGPDGFGFFERTGVGLAHARLSIIDLAGGHQPMANEDGTVWVTFNGEIFNYIELRAELESAGHHFATRSDTEVLVHAYEEYGLEFVHRLNGQFAFAIWDERLSRLVLYRDRVGIIPLFYAARHNRLVFASEIKALQPAIGVPDRLNVEALDQILTFWSAPPPSTLLPDVQQLPPGHYLIADRNGIQTRAYWDWHFPIEDDYATDSPEHLAETLRALLIDATRLRLRSDVPVGAYLSGGLDSSILTTIIRRHTDTPLRTFSIGFEEQTLDETAYQQQLIAHLQADHSRIQCGNGDVADWFSPAVWHAETAVVRTAMVPMMRLSRLVHEQGYRVVLTGEGADEVFGGYDLFRETKVRQFWSRRPDSRMRPALLARLYPYLQVSPAKMRAYTESFFGAALDTPRAPFFSHLPRWITTARCKEFFSDTVRSELRDGAMDRFERDLPAAFSGWHWLNRAQYLESHTLLSGYLLWSQGDRMLMANSVEGRFPFLDHRVIEFARRLPPTLLIKGLNEKYLLKKAFGHELPQSIVTRPKQPYRAPGVPAFFQGAWAEEARDLLSSETIRRFDYFDPVKVGHLIRKIEAGRAVGEKDNMALVAILSTQLLHRRFIDEARVPAGVMVRHAAADTKVHSH
jgi:asparagine synthase (glutamine-hydrolysing)